MAERKEIKETLIKEYDKLQDGRLRVRVVETNRGRLLDIREYIESKGFTGFTTKGVRLNKASVEKAIGILTEALTVL